MSKIKVLIVAVFAISISLTAVAQEYNAKLTVKYDVTKLNDLKQNHPDQLEVLNYFVDGGCYFIDMPAKKVDYKELQKVDPKTGEINYDHVITTNDLVDFNPMEYNCVYNDAIRNYYKVGDTGKLLVVPSESDFKIAIENKKIIEKL